MSLVVFDKVDLAFGPRVLLHEATMNIGPRERIGLVGLNGTGKSTLLKIILGVQSVDAGEVVRRRGLRIGYLPQEVQEIARGRLLETVLAAAPGMESIDRRLRETEEALRASNDPDEQMELSETLAEVHASLDHFEAHYAPHEAEKILLGLGFEISDFARPLAEFSGGWKTRAALAGILFAKPDLLLLDEPTNHLDVPSLLWFEDFLSGYKNALVLISHDREFLNKQIDRTLSFEVEGLRSYTGNFEQYLELRSQEEEIIEAQAKNQERLIAQAERFIRRFRYKATKARQVQSRIKQIEKIERVAVPLKQKVLDFDFRQAERSGREVVGVRKLSKSFGAIRLFKNLSLSVRRGERVAIIGKNGAGKTTLLRMMAAELSTDAGEVVLGHNVTMGYYAQHHADQIRTSANILQEVWSVDPSALLTQVRNVCGMFLFTGEEVEKSCGVLSGGEKARVVLAKLLMRPTNLLLMDEPTNHLDLYAAEALAEALDTYEGTLVFVSHNRSFINRLATVIWDLDGRGVNEYPGNLDDYQYHMDNARRAEATADAGDNSDSAAEKPTSRKDARRIAAQKQDERNRALRPLKKEIADIEEAVTRLENEQAELEKALSDPSFYADGDRAREASLAYKKNKDVLDEFMLQWELKGKELMELEQALSDE